jgi:hypothetical protein
VLWVLQVEISAILKQQQNQPFCNIHIDILELRTLYHFLKGH